MSIKMGLGHDMGTGSRECWDEGDHVYTWVIGKMGFEKIKLRVVFCRFWSILPLYFLETRRHLGLPYKKVQMRKLHLRNHSLQ